MRLVRPQACWRLAVARETMAQFKAIPAVSLLALAAGAAALGAVAIGALAIGSLAIGRLVIKKARFGALEVDELRVGKLLIAKGDPPAEIDSPPVARSAPSSPARFRTRI